MNNYHRKLNFPVDFVSSKNPVAFMAPLLYKYGLRFNSEERQFYVLPTSEIPKEFLSWFQNKFPGVDIATWEIFYTPKGQTMPIHSDGFQPFINFVKINYVYHSPNSKMEWYSLPEGTALPTDSVNEHGRPYTVPPRDICKKEFSATVGEPSLVNVGQLHSVDNTEGDDGRWCFCLVPYMPSRKPHSRLEFKESLDLFADYIVND